MTDTPAWGTPEPVGPKLLDVPEFVMRERQGFFASSASYEILTPAGELLGRIDKEGGTGGLFSRKDLTYLLTGPDERVIAEIGKPSSWGRNRFRVTTADGTEVGGLEQENWWTAPRLLLTTDGFAARLSGGGFLSGGVRELTEAESGRPLGTVAQEWDGLGAMFAGTETYLVQLSKELTGTARLLAVVATACIDLILNEDEKRRRSSSQF